MGGLTVRNIKTILGSKIFRHCIFIISVFVLQITQDKSVVNIKFEKIYWLFVIKDTVTDLLIFYYFSYVLIPNISKIRLYPILLFLSLTVYLFIYWGNFVMFRMLYDHKAYSDFEMLGIKISDALKIMAASFKNTTFVGGIFDTGIIFINLVWYAQFTLPFILFKALIDFYQLQLKNSTYQKELLSLELNFLKTQINPHFLFNTLNNIYSMVAYKDKLVADSILNLSDMMRYSLYETNQEKVQLSKEIIFIENYLNLEKIRHGNNVKIQFEFGGEIEKCKIPPFLLIILIENAIKHGIVPSPAITTINISLTVKDNKLSFSVINTKNVNIYKSRTGGVGLKNLRRRLELIYPQRYQLIVKNDEFYYQVELRINEY